MLNKILGSLYGQALGDAWAMPALFTPDQTWQHFGGWITDFLPGPADHQFHPSFPAGRITDDTEQAFALANAIIADNGVTVTGVAQAIVAWYDRVDGENSPYIGPSTRRAVRAIKQGVDPQQSGRFGDTNGAAMRIAPIGLIHPGDIAGAVEDATRSCIPTHHTDVAASGAAAVAGAIAHAMMPDVTLDSIIQKAIQSAILGRSKAPIWIGASIARRIEIAVEIARRDWPIRTRLQELYDVVGAMVGMSESVPAAFGVLALAAGDPQQTAIYAAALSGDADTIGAMACAIAGAWRGVDAISPKYIAILRAANPELDFEGVAHGLAKIAQANLAARTKSQ